MRATPIRLVAILAAGALQTLSLSPFEAWPAALLSIFVFLAATNALNPNAKLTPKLAFRYGWLLGFGLFSSGASWVYVSINNYGNAPPLLAGSLTLIFVAGLGLFHGLMMWIYAHNRTNSYAWNAVIFAAIWVLNDGFRSFFLTGFPWLYLGDGQLNGPLRGWIPLIGSYGATFIIVLSAGILAAAVHLRNRASIGASVLLIVTLWLPGLWLNDKQWTTDTGDSLTTALLQLNIPQEDKWKRSQRPKTIALLKNMTAEHQDKDLIFWPETALPMFYNQAKPLLNELSKSANQSDTGIITGIPYRGWDADAKQVVLHNSIISIGKGEGIYHKQKLVPFGEYVPLQDVLRGLIAFFDLPMSNFRKGPTEQAYLKTKGFLASPFICYEIVYTDQIGRAHV